ncbi:hypothetical protein [Treponema sp.]|uniref:hypothetical protein n=1 Tax=Treponema sp. TaxID=166 RepID=UPI003F094C0D
MNLKKTGLIFLFAAVVSAGAFSSEISFFLGNNSDLKFNGKEYDEPVLEQSNAFSTVAKIPLNSSGFTSLLMEASISHTYDKIFGDNSDSESEFTADLNRFVLSSVINCGDGKLYLNAGRTFFADLTGLVLVQSLDGASIKFSSPFFAVNAFGGYTGLLNERNISILGSDGFVYEPDDENDFYDFCAPYIIGGMCINAPYLIFNQTISIEGFGAWNTEGPADSPDDDDNRFYGTLKIDGALSSNLFYSLSGTAYTTDFSDFALLGKAELALFPEFKSSSLMFSASYASGDSGSLVPFVGITKTTACFSNDEPAYSGIAKAGLSGSIFPVEKLCLGLGGDVLFRDNESDFEYYGMQVFGNAQYKLYSDLKLSFSLTHFEGDEKYSSRTQAVVNAVISF